MMVVLPKYKSNQHVIKYDFIRLFHFSTVALIIFLLGIPMVSMGIVINEHRIAPLSMALAENLPFKIAVCDQTLVDAYPLVLVLGRAEYGACLDVFFARLWNFPSETAVCSSDQLWITMITNCIPGVSALLNQHDPSSRVRQRPDTSLMFNGALVLKAEAKWLESDMSTALDELTSKFFPGAASCFPLGGTSTIGVTTCSTMASLFVISWVGNQFSCVLHSSYAIQTSMNDRVRFIVDLVKVMRWIATVEAPTRKFHLVPSVRLRTRNGHFVTWQARGILKELHNPNKFAISRILKVYAAHLPHVEWGEAVVGMSNAILVTRVGFKLVDAIAAGKIQRNDAIDHVRLGLHELHHFGYSHCDVVIDNVFVNDGVAFLDDLEYLTPNRSKAPQTARWDKETDGELTPAQLDNMLYLKFVAAVHQL
jgi:hypothetical protein